CTNEHRAQVKNWLDARKLIDVKVSDLFDIWWD
ncbi:MAG: 50S ribosome-binding protein YggL, partial [Serratia symbiotica]|nr:50S ribosome-binding protein YggL [Serratia symbiotica]